MDTFERSSVASVPVWAGPAPDGSDPTVHLWYADNAKVCFRLCDNVKWSSGEAVHLRDESYARCRDCRDLYALDATLPSQRFGHLEVGLPILRNEICYTQSMVDTSDLMEYTHESQGIVMLSNMINSVPMTAFARFYDASGPEKVRVVRDVRLMASDPQGYRGRDYYFQLRNLLRQTHWQTDDIDTFEDALDRLVSNARPDKKEHYRKIGQAYIDFWRKRDGHCFDVPVSMVDVAGLPIRVSLEVGMGYAGNDLALKIWWNAPRPKRAFRQTVQYLTELASAGWPPHWSTALWDVRRDELLPPVRIPKDFAFALEGQAVAFRQIWVSLGE